MDRKEALSVLIRGRSIANRSAEYYYPSISDKIKIKITKNFDPNINVNNIVAFHDTTLTKNAKCGIVFTLAGLYYRDTLTKTYYLKYNDIETFDLIKHKKETTDVSTTLVVILKDGTRVEFGYGNFYKNALRMLIWDIKDTVRNWPEATVGRETGEVVKLGLTTTQLKQVHGIIHAASVAAGGVGTGLAQIPLSDNAIIAPIQVTMITTLAKVVFDLRLSEGAAKGIIGSFTASFVGRSVSQVLIGWIPVIGNVINTATAAGITEAVGWAVVKHFTELTAEERAKYRVEGMKDGYAAASDEYEAKLKAQAAEFIRQKKIAAEQFTNYQKLLKEYEEYIEKLEKIIKSMSNSNVLIVNGETNENLISMKKQYEELKNLKCS